MKKFFHKHFYLKAFFMGFLTAFCLFIPFMVADKGFFTYAGDFNSQQIPFYMYMHQRVRSGSLNWGWAIDLGSSVINSFSFYLLGSPFFWLSCLFPYKRVPYLMPYLLMLKFAVGNLAAFGYLRRYAKNDNYAMVGALLYTFSGFSIYNIFFNHFIEAVVFFPFLLWAMDEMIYTGRKGLFPLAVALNLVNNYFFFIGQAVFLLIYFLCKIHSKEYRISVKQFLNLAFESVTGCFMGIVLFVPSLFSIVENPRTLSGLSDFGLWLYGSVQQYFAIGTSALLPPDVPYSPSLFTEGLIKWTSMSCFVAFGGLFGLFVFAKYRKNSSFFKVFKVCTICAFVPVLNSMFYAFNSAYYARWYYMPILMLCAMNMQSFSMEKQQIYHGLKCTAVLTAILLVFGLTPVEKDGVFSLGLSPQPAVYWMNMLIAFLSLYLVFVAVSSFKDTKEYTQKLTSGTLVIVMLYSSLHMALTKLPQWNSDRLYKLQNYDVADSLLSDVETDNCRIDTYNCFDNFGLFINRPCIQFFGSTVTPSIMEFYPQVGVARDVSSKPGRNMYALRTLLSTRYLIMPQWEVSEFEAEADLYGFDLVSDTYPYNVYENTNFIPMGFVYENYVSYEGLETVGKQNRANILLRAIATDESLIAKYNLPLQELPLNRLYDHSYSFYLTDVQERNKNASYYFRQTADGFDCNIALEKGNLVFFSVPYDKGFTAFVNGEKAEIEKVSYGMSAVYAPAGDNRITFVYKTPYLDAGVFLTLSGWVIYLSYVFINFKKSGTPMFLTKNIRS